MPYYPFLVFEVSLIFPPALSVVGGLNFIKGCKSQYLKNKLPVQKSINCKNSYIENIKDRDGRTGYHHACIKGHFDIAEMLKEYLNFEFHQKDEIGFTAFHYACEYGHIKITRMIAERSFEQNLKVIK